MPVEVCSQCHNTTFHFDQTRHAIVCDVCGWEQNRAQRAGELLTYDQNRQKAIAYVKARDYTSAKPFLERMRSIRPDDPDIYYLHLMGLSRCCQNDLLDPRDANEAACLEHYWDVYRSLSNNTQIFEPYFRRRKRKKKQLYDKLLSKHVLLALITYVPFFMLLSLCFAGEGAAIAVVPLAIVILCVKPLTKLFRLWKDNRQ